MAHDVGYDQPGASGNYGGYVDDITLSHLMDRQTLGRYKRER
jgi:hypothetical protein